MDQPRTDTKDFQAQETQENPGAQSGEEQDPRQALRRLEEENQTLQDRLHELTQLQEASRDDREQLDRLQEQNQALRGRYAALALSDALTNAAGKLGISAQAAMLHKHRFQCRLDDQGRPSISPNPTETLLTEMKNDPLLAASGRALQDRDQASAANTGTVAPEKLDPVRLLRQLDRDPRAKTQFISRHGPGAYIDLADRARSSSADG
jgi:hypothetical protein